MSTTNSNGDGATGWPPSVPDLGTLVALAGFALVLAVFGDPLALALGVGVGTALVRAAFGMPYAIATGHVGLVAAFPAGIDPVAFAAVETPLLVLVFLEAGRTNHPRTALLVTTLSVAAIGGATWLALEYASLAVAGGVLLGSFGFVAYAVHRYELVRFGLVEDVESTDERAGSRDERAMDANTG